MRAELNIGIAMSPGRGRIDRHDPQGAGGCDPCRCQLVRRLIVVCGRGPRGCGPGCDHGRRCDVPVLDQITAERIAAGDERDGYRGDRDDPRVRPGQDIAGGCGRRDGLGSTDRGDQAERGAEQAGDPRHSQRVVDQRDEQDQAGCRPGRDQGRALLPVAALPPARDQRCRQHREPGQHQDDGRQAPFEDHFEIVVMRMVDAERRDLSERLDGAIDPLETAETGAEREALADREQRRVPILVAEFLRQRREAREQALHRIGPHEKEPAEQVERRGDEQRARRAPDADDQRQRDDQRERQQCERGARTRRHDPQREDNGGRDRGEPLRLACPGDTHPHHPGLDHVGAHHARYRGEDDRHQQQGCLMVPVDEEADAEAAMRALIQHRGAARPRRHLQHPEHGPGQGGDHDAAQGDDPVGQRQRGHRHHRRDRHQQRKRRGERRVRRQAERMPPRGPAQQRVDLHAGFATGQSGPPGRGQGYEL